MTGVGNFGGGKAAPGIVMGVPAAWGDLAEVTEPMKGNLFICSIKLPAAVLAKIPRLGGQVLSILCSAANLPQENLIIEEVATKLSSYDIVVGKERGELGLTFKEQAGAPVSSIMSAWHYAIVDARKAGIGFVNEFKADVWVGAIAGNGAPYYWWHFSRCFPKSRGNNVGFSNDNKTAVDIEVPFSYLEMSDGSQALAGEGANFATLLGLSAREIGI